MTSSFTQAEDQIRRMRDLLIDAHAMLQHYISGKADNWDGSTKKQAVVLVMEIASLLHEQARSHARKD